jgi:hypothetical protein
VADDNINKETHMSIRIDRDRMSCETKASSFWADHNEDLHDPEYALAFARESQRVAAVDRLAAEAIDLSSSVTAQMIDRATKEARRG